MDPIDTKEIFEEDAELPVIELEDGSAIIEMPDDGPTAETDFYSNLAETLDAFDLNTLATDLLELVEKDKEARKKRDEQYAEGIKRTGLGDDAPGGAMFSGASRAVHPVLAEGCVDFAARAIKELIPANGPVKTKILGKADAKTLDRAKRKRDYLNWLLTNKMRSYRDEKEVLLTQLPLGGSQYEKYFVDPSNNSYHMEFVPVDMLLLPFASPSFSTAPRITQMLDLTEAEFERRVKSKFYRDIDNLITEQAPDRTDSQTATEKVEGKSDDAYNVDGVRRVYEILVEREIDEELGPYVVHVDEASNKICAVYRNWKEGDEDKVRLEWFVENKFIPWRGAYGIGLPHLIGGLAGSLTGTLRALLDSGHINNSPGAIKLKGGRVSGQNITIEQTQVTELEAPPGVDDIRKVMMPLPFNPPSQVLFQLLEWITNQAKGVVATAEERIADAGNNMPVGTTLALIEQGSQVFSSIHARLHESQRRSLEIICRLVHDYPNAEDLAKFELTEEDFDENDDITPVSDPRIFSEAQRYAQLQEVLKVPGLFPEQNWNRNALARRTLELLRVEYADEVLPPPPEAVTADPVSENYAAVKDGAPLKASPEQDHIAHLREHLRFLLDPMLASFPGPAVMPILQHCSEHLLLVYQAAAQTAATVKAAQDGAEMSDLALADGAEYAMGQLGQQLGQLPQLMQQAQQMVQAKMPQPPVEPVVQKNFEAAMAEINRKAEADKARLELDTKKAGAEFEADKQQQTIDARLAEMGNAFKLQLGQMQEEGKQAAEELRQQVEMMKNDRDNEQKQMTELLKNRDDNQTAVLIEQMRQMVTEALPPAQTEPRQDDGVLREMQRMLGEIERAKTGDALTATVEALRVMMGTQQQNMARAEQLLQEEQ